MTTPISGSAVAQTAKSTSSAASDALDKNTFMKLLVAQLKYQNPLSPTDSNQYMSQMAVFAQVEKLTALVSSQQQSQAWQERLSAQAMVGQQVTGVASDDLKHTGVVTAVQLTSTGPQLTLEDGSTMRPDQVTTVSQAPST